ncbi:conserved hypothetical protein [Perkinsus marinus ATCC 50983]|uniref:Mei2-like C-terminal RNA recognition motif domain-containing protein n=1 Tax=Perkinsus marinus (strain ATCC 50983 / TXsc) TaxID=423536 RepID=C5LE29_PERM5|nr:conserved hypothetical protein [Perkinsus marinus ATCC 50983]EER05027.1 conserved hypothetical protein [Perkinsus marinus ATCC 50983]|eukprot:XP_002773211.1 conserved hypothetical protein [Perkinsus marinus ATCC 50983]
MRRHSSPGPRLLTIPKGHRSLSYVSSSQKTRRDSLDHKDVPKRFNLRSTDTFVDSHLSRGAHRTTLMLRSIPYSYTPRELLDELVQKIGFQGEYDFFYLPVNSKLSCNVGYAFMNFRNPQYCELFKEAFSHHTFEKAVRGKKVVGQASYAHVQGLDANLKYLKCTRVGSLPAKKSVAELFAPMVFVDGRDEPMSVQEFYKLQEELLTGVSTTSSTEPAEDIFLDLDESEQLLKCLQELVDFSPPSTPVSGNPFDI